MEVKRVKLEIKKGLIIRDPVKKHAHKGTVVVSLSTFWRRRINDGDAKIIGEVKKSNPKTKQKGGETKQTPSKSSNKSNNKLGGKE